MQFYPWKAFKTIQTRGLVPAPASTQQLVCTPEAGGGGNGRSTGGEPRGSEPRSSLDSVLALCVHRGVSTPLDEDWVLQEHQSRGSGGQELVGESLGFLGR